MTGHINPHGFQSPFCNCICYVFSWIKIFWTWTWTWTSNIRVTLPLQGETTDDHGFPAQWNNNVVNAWNHQRTIICIQNRLLFCLISSVNDLDTIACPSVSSIGAITKQFGIDIIVTYGTFSIIFILVTTDVVGDNWCGRLGLWPFRFVAVPVCGRSGLWPFRFVAVSVCGRFGLWPFRFVAISVCGRFGLWPFRLWPFRSVAVMTCYRSHKPKCIGTTNPDRSVLIPI